MTARPTTPTLVIACFALIFVLAGCIAASPCTLPEGLVLPLEAEQQIALPGLDAQLRKCITSVYGESPYRITGHEGWDRYLKGDNSALSNRAKVGALLFFSEDGVVVDPGLDFERFYQEFIEPPDEQAQKGWRQSRGRQVATSPATGFQNEHAAGGEVKLAAGFGASFPSRSRAPSPR